MNLISRVINKVLDIKIHEKTSKMVANHSLELVSFGTSYGGWTVPSRSVRPGAVAVCAGAGEDLSFDVELNRRGVDVYVVDPTPRAKTHYEHLAKALLDPSTVAKTKIPYELDGLDADRLQFVDKGLWSREETLKFFVPENDAHVSHSVKNLFNTERYFKAECTTPKALCEELNLPKPDILKMDIEGAEHEVIDSMCDDDFLPDVLCVEFDEARAKRDKRSVDRLSDTVAQLREKGYQLVNISNYWDFTFARI